MLFKYKAVDEQGINKEGEIDAPNKDIAISGLQHRGLVILSIKGGKESKSLLKMSFFEKIPQKDIVILSKQIATLFEAQVSALKVFTMLAASAKSDLMRFVLTNVTDDLQAGLSISQALAKHPDVFSQFYVNMVKAGEETGKLNETFNYLADYLDRQYALTSKTKNALIYPLFVVITFFVVMILMFVIVIPKLSAIITESGTEPPVFTKIVIATSQFFVSYGFIIVIFVVLLGIWLWQLSTSQKGKEYLDKLFLSLPGFGNLFQKLYLSRIADNMDTMLTSGITIVRAIDITSEVVGSHVYKQILKDSMESVKSGLALSAAFEKHPEIPVIMIQMVKVGEESGKLGEILKTLGDFYKREVDAAVDTLVGLIEPIMIVVLGLGVGILLTSILLPIYNMAGSIS